MKEGRGAVEVKEECLREIKESEEGEMQERELQ